MFDIRHDLAPRGAVGPELVGSDPLRRTTLLAHEPRQQAPRGLCVPPDLHDFVEDISVLIDSLPEIALLAADRDDDLVEMPDIDATWRLALQPTGIVDAEFDRPASDGFVRYDNAALKHISSTRRRLKATRTSARRWRALAWLLHGRRHAHLCRPRGHWHVRQGAQESAPASRSIEAAEVALGVPPRSTRFGSPLVLSRVH